MGYNITYEANPKSEDTDVLFQGIVSYAKQQRDHEPMQPFAFFIRDENKKVLGGCNGNIAYGLLYIDQLWVKDELRGQDYGTLLMQKAEKLAREKNCVVAAVNTMDWEALGFYQKLGYHVEFEQHGLAKNSILYYLRKDFK